MAMDLAMAMAMDLVMDLAIALALTMALAMAAVLDLAMALTMVLDMAKENHTKQTGGVRQPRTLPKPSYEYQHTAGRRANPIHSPTNTTIPPMFQDIPQQPPINVPKQVYIFPDS